MAISLRPCRVEVATRVVGVALVISGLALPPAAGARGVGTVRGGLIAFRDANGIGLINPTSGRQRMVLTVPLGCSSAAGGVGPIGLAGPVWAPSSGPSARLYFWVTYWQYKPTSACNVPAVPSWVGPGGAVLVQADPFDGTLRAVAAAPDGLPCQPGEDLVAVPGALAFTNGGCDEPQVEALALPLRPGAEPEGAPLALPAGEFAPHCAVDERLLGEGPGGKVLLQEVGTQCPPPPPSLQWWGPSAHAVGLFSPRPPRGVWDDLRASALSPNSGLEAFALGTGGAGVLNLKTGAWSAQHLPRCAGPACEGALSVSFSPGGAQIALAANGDLLVAPAAGGTPEVLAADGVASVSWSGAVSAAAPPGGPGRALAGALPSLWAPFSKFWGEGEKTMWRVEPARMPTPTVSVVSLPEPASALLMISDQVALAAGIQAREAGSWWRSTDGGRTWTTLNAHCAELQGATPDFLPCQVGQMAALPGGVALARGDRGLGLWRSTDEGLRWQRQPFQGTLIEGGPWAAGSTAYLLVVPAQANGQAVPSAIRLSLLVSTDAGRTWRKLFSVPRDDPANAAARLGRFFVLAPGRFAELYRAGDCSLPADLRASTNDGRTWAEVPPGQLVVPGALAEVAPSRLVLGASFCGSAAPHYGEGMFTHSPGPGGTWRAAGVPTGYRDLYGLGITSRFAASAHTVKPFSVAALGFPGGREGVAVGSAVLTSTDQYGNLAADPTTTASQDLIFVSSDGGRTWSDESLPGPGLKVLSCAGPGHCLAAHG